MCLHGWLDNAASFVPLAPYLKSYDVIALDLAGHGRSDHRPAGTRYHMMDNLWDLDAVLDSLDWQDCFLIGHSLGGVIASTYSAAAPERVKKLITLDGLGALSAPENETASRLRISMQATRLPGTGLKDYPDIETAAKIRQRVSGFPLEIARILSKRALKLEDGVYRWRADPGLNWRSPVLLTEDQVLDILTAIKAPVLSIISSEIRKMPRLTKFTKRKEAVRDLTHRDIDGHHHFHMDQAELTAQFILEFLNTTDSDTERSNASVQA